MKIQAALLEIPPWDGGIDAKAAEVINRIASAAFSTDFDHALTQLALQDGNAEQLVILRKAVGKVSAVRSSIPLFI
jgi:hypothetical protein